MSSADRNRWRYRNDPVYRENQKRKAKRAKQDPTYYEKYARQYYERNRQIYIARAQEWRRQNPGKARANRVARNRLQAINRCTCCTYAQLNSFYIIAVWCGAEVDHKIPLAMGGKHCCSNLQILTVVNHKKKTRIDAARIGWRRRRNADLR